MFRTALKSVAAHRLRFLLTAAAIVVGVAFVSGSFVFTDTINARFQNLFSDVYAGVDVTVRPVDGTTIDAALLDRISALEDIEQAAGFVEGFAQIVDESGQPIGGQGPPTLGFSWIDTEALNPLRIADGNGRAPVAPGEAAIDVATAETNGWSLGDLVEIQTEGGVEEFELVGLVNFGTEDNLAGATLAVFELSEAQRLFGLEGELTSIDAVGSIDAEQLAKVVGAELPEGLEAVTGEQQTSEQLAGVTEGLSFLNTALLAFAAVSVLVGGFIIQNTFRIIVGQRTRELALLRAIGATSRQVTRLVTIEALVVSVVASAIGVAAGIGLAMGIKAGMARFGLEVPDGPITLLPRTIAVGMGVGVVVTLVSALLPARRAAKVPPVAAMRAEAIETSTPGSLRRRGMAGGIALLVGSTAIGASLFGDLPSPALWVGAGALVVFLAVSVLAPLFARPAAAILGGPFRGVTGKLARENTTRNPRRSAATASALMIGVALVAFVSVFAASVKASVIETLDEAFPADLALQSSNFAVGISDAALAAVSATEEVAVLSPVTFWQDWGGVDPDTIGAVFDGGDGWDPALLADGAIMLAGTAIERGLAVGDVVTIEGGSGPVEVPLTGTFTNANLGTMLVATQTLENAVGPLDASLAFVSLTDGLSVDDGQAILETALVRFPTVDVSTSSEVIADAAGQVDQLVGLFTGLLGLAILIAVMGIANTLMLSIVERTREIGLLRAVGMGRGQVGRMIRSEAVIIAVFGATLGVIVGSTLGTTVVISLADEGLGAIDIPFGQLAIWLAAAGVAGVIAAVWPARKAGRLDVLGAISYE
jgi:putative ABC transport system permease protein